MGRNGESGALGLAAARGGVELGVGARFARFGNGTGTSNVASEPSEGPRFPRLRLNENILRPVGFFVAKVMKGSQYCSFGPYQAGKHARRLARA